MKTKYLYIGNNIFLISKLKIALNVIEVVVDKYPLSAIKYLNSNSSVEVVIFESTEETDKVLEFVRFFRENINRDILFFILVDTKQYLSKRNARLNKFLKQGADDIFYLNIDIHLTNKEIRKVCKRIEFLAANKENLSLSVARKKDHFRIPLWKRVFDILFSLLAIILLSPVFLFIAIAIRFESKGKVYYTSKRVGTGYKIFNFYKFRSMSVDADKKVDALMSQNQYATANDNLASKNVDIHSSGDILLLDEDNMIFEQDFLVQKRKKQETSFFKISDDPRITEVGRFIRNTSLDELLQLFNILKGDMSVVGNRPLPLYEAEVLTTDRWAKRFLAPAGLTGLWQVTKRAKSSQMSPDERKQLDIEYSDKYSFAGDLKIILRTVPALFQHENI